MYHGLDKISWYNQSTLRLQRANRLDVNRCLFVKEITKKKCDFTFSKIGLPNIGTLLTQYLLTPLRMDLI